MPKNFEEVKINIPKNNKEVIRYCKMLAGQRQLSARIVLLLSQDMKARQIGGTVGNTNSTDGTQSDKK